MNTKRFILSLLSSVSIFPFSAAAQNIASPAAPDNFSWTSGTTLQVPLGCEYTSGGASAITTGHMGAVACDVNRDVLVNVINANPNGATGSANSSPVVPASDYAGPVNVTPHDCSVTLTAGGTAQNAFTASATKHGFTIANIDASDSEPVWFSVTTTASAGATGSYPLASPTATSYASLSSYTSPPNFGVNTALSVVAGTTGHVISCTYW